MSVSPISRFIPFCIFTFLLSTIASASHQTLTGNDSTFSAIGTWNGKRVYLSSPTHTNSGNRGELGWEENINGRHWNIYAANGNFINGSYSTASNRNLRTRGYQVIVGQNSRNGDYIGSRNRSDNWGADVHLVTHTNAGNGDYFLLLIDDTTSTQKDIDLAERLKALLGPKIPGGQQIQPDGGGFPQIAELKAAAEYNVYSELIFHDNGNHVWNYFGSNNNWGQSVTYDAWRYGYAIDLALGYP